MGSTLVRDGYPVLPPPPPPPKQVATVILSLPTPGLKPPVLTPVPNPPPPTDAVMPPPTDAVMPPPLTKQQQDDAAAALALARLRAYIERLSRWAPGKTGRRT